MSTTPHPSASAPNASGGSNPNAGSFSGDPFRALELEPTLDRARIKRAYFAAIARTPPHKDAEAFGRIRGAYEALMRPGGSEAAFLLAAPADPAAPYRERYAAQIEQARARQRAQAHAEASVAHFVERARSTTLGELLEAAAGPLEGEASGSTSR